MRITKKDLVVLVVIFLLGAAAATGIMFSLLNCPNASFADKKALGFAVAHPKRVYIPVTITVYNPTPNQTDDTPFHTADGSFINPKLPQRWCAVSRDLLKLFGYGAKIDIRSKDCPYINGLWEIHDTGGMNGKKRCVDLLISNPHVVKFGGCWRGGVVL